MDACTTPTRTRRGPSIEDLFWAHVEKVDGACWLWRGATCKGYGTFGSRRFANVPGIGRTSRAHRLAWIFTRGPIPDGLHVLHRCDNPPCCNPDHLFLGTHAQNVADMIAKGRHRGGMSPEQAPRGERHWGAKLTDEQVAAIRAMPRKRGLQTRLARQYGVSDATISMILSGKSWRGAPTEGAK